MAHPARRPDPVVRPLSRAATRRCARPGCPSPARASLWFAYDTREAVITTLVNPPGHEHYDLCQHHADRTRPPNGWGLRDDRPEEPVADDGDELPTDLGSAHTVAVLAAALHGDPDPAGSAGPHDRDPSADEPDEPDVAAPRDTSAPAVTPASRREARTVPAARRRIT